MDEAVRKCAQNEWLASQELQRAEQLWRDAWWETTLALAELSSVKEGFDAAVSELGQSRDHLAQRRRVGKAVEPSCRREAHKLPPTLSLNWVREGRNLIDGRAIKTLLAADEENVSTRQFIEQIARPPVRRTPVALPRIVEPASPAYTPPAYEAPAQLTPVPLPEPTGSWSPPVPPRPDARPPVTAPIFQPHAAPTPPEQLALSTALSEIEVINRSMARLDSLIPNLDDDTRPQFRAKLLELSMQVQMMIEGLNPESSLAFTDRDAAQLLGGQG